VATAETIPTARSVEPIELGMPDPAVRFVMATRRLVPVWRVLGAVEALTLGERYRAARIDRPLYVCGIARSGTTITLEMLGSHPDSACESYRDFVMPYLPYWWRRFGPENVGLASDEPKERLHRDGLLVTKDSPETIEEVLWQGFWPDLHDERRSNVVDESASNPAFERFYRRHLRKLLACDPGKSRFATKNNYYVTRLGYLRKLFPDLRLFFVVRDPKTHIASLMKLDRMFSRATEREVRLMHALGHYEFGPGKRFVNVGDDAVIREIRRLWAARREVAAWAVYWNSVYAHVGSELRKPGIAAAATVIRFEDLCERPGETIDRVIAHAELDRVGFAERRVHYLATLRAPTYYRPDFTVDEAADIAAITRPSRERFGY
jgi:hypothetical protein